MSPITLYLSKLEPRFEDQNVLVVLKIQCDAFRSPTDHFDGQNLKKKSSKIAIFLWRIPIMTPITLFRHIRMKNGCQIQNQCIKITPGDTKARKMTYDVIKRH